MKRHGSDSSQTSSSPGSSCSLSPQLSDSVPSSTCTVVSSDDENLQRKQAAINRTYIISKRSEKKVGESSRAIASTSSNQRDSHTIVYSSSSKSSVKPPLEVIPSPAESSNGPSSVASEFDVVPSLDVDDIVSDYSVFSPFEIENHHEDQKFKNEKTPHSLKKPRTPTLYYKTKVEDRVPCYVTPTSEQRECPLPILTWADRESVWTSMVRKDERASLCRDINMFDSHPGLQPRMRAILLDWIIEVCEVYKLHRETYYLTIDYLDRYLSSKSGISKNQLQLIGITCLFIASKVRNFIFSEFQF